MNSMKDNQRLFSEMLDLKHLQDGSTAANFLKILNENPRLSGTLAMKIYRNNTIGARLKTLQIIYQVIEKILGEACFKMVSTDFVSNSPSLQSDLNIYGRKFPDFLADIVKQKTAFTDFEYLPDLALLEWYYHAAFYAADNKQVIDLPSLSNITVKEGFIISRSRAAFILQTTFPVLAIWQNHQADAPAKEITALTNYEYLLVYRKEFKPEIIRIKQEEWLILKTLDKALSIEDTVKLTIDKGIEIQKVLPRMIEQGWIKIAVTNNEN